MRKMWTASLVALSLLAAATGFLQRSRIDAQASDAGPAMDPARWQQVFLEARIFLGRLPPVMPGGENDTPEKIALGKRLYFERGISCNATQSCHECHLLSDGGAGVDNASTSKGALGTIGKRNAPTVINAGFQTMQFWDGRAHNLAEQAKGPVLNPIEMGMSSADDVVNRIRDIEGYEEAFAKVFPGESEPVTYDHIADAIASFERTLVAPSRFDKLLAGDENALTIQEKRGLAAFVENSCIECHTGATVGGRTFRKIGEERPYSDDSDLGRYEITGKDEDRQVFKVPMLRNVTRTHPYFHHGEIPTLEHAVQLMGMHQLDIELPPETIADIIAFLGALEGDPPVDLK